MNIAIITWHGGPNAGTFFQLYGLYSYLEKRGHHVEVINYQNQKEDFISRGWKYYATQPLALIQRKIQRKRGANALKVAETPYAEELKLRDKRFEEMYKMLKFTKPVSTDADFAALNRQFDAFVVGSDQIWNASMLNRRYLLDFVESGKIKASYCPSVGSAHVMVRQRQVFKQYLNDFNYISTRERCLQEVLSKILSQRVEHLLDPSMLFPREEYLKMAHLPEQFTPGSYLLCYFMPSNEAQAEQARQFAKRRGLKLVIMAMHAASFSVDGAEVYAAAGPAEFVGLIANAAVVFSSSFHCTIFSILLHKDLYVFEQNFTSKASNTNQRYIEQLDTYGISHRYICWGEHIAEQHQKAIDYHKVEAIFQERLAQSYSYLNQFC